MQTVFNDFAMRIKKNSVYNWKNFPKQMFKIRKKLATEILHDFIVQFDTSYHMNGVINIGNNEDTDKWSFRKRFIGVEKLFTMGMIEDETHKDILSKMVYQMALSRVGDKDYMNRAEEIAAAMRAKILVLKKELTS